MGRSKDGIPTWDGSASTYQAYEEQVLVWEQGIKYENRYLCGPRLAGELTGAAQRMIVGKPPTWVSFNGGVEVFLRHLRESLGKPQIPEATECLNKYFRGSKRRVGEGINDYITRKMETYWRACQALKRVMPRKRPEEGEPPAASWTSSSYQPGWSSRRSSCRRNRTPPSRRRPRRAGQTGLGHRVLPHGLPRRGLHMEAGATTTATITQDGPGERAATTRRPRPRASRSFRSLCRHGTCWPTPD